MSEIDEMEPVTDIPLSIPQKVRVPAYSLC